MKIDYFRKEKKDRASCPMPTTHETAAVKSVIHVIARVGQKGRETKTLERRHFWKKERKNAVPKETKLSRFSCLSNKRKYGPSFPRKK